jgi:ribose 5-phosphate isomerase B
MKIYVGADHAGFELKEYLAAFLKKEGYEVIDKGAYEYEADDDYPDFVAPVAHAVSMDPKKAVGIILGGSGQGEAMVANRFPNVRAIVFNGQYKPKDGRKVPHEIVIARKHNDANILSLGARFLDHKDAKAAVKLWLKTPFSGEVRHKRRIDKIDSLDIHAQKKIEKIGK